MVEKKELKRIKEQAEYCLLKMERLNERIERLETDYYVSTFGYKVEFIKDDQTNGITKTQLMDEIKALRMELLILSKSLEKLS